MTTNSNDVLELSPESNKSTDKRITKKDLKALFWRSFPLNIMWSFDRQMNVGFCYDMIPVIKRLYDKPEDRSEAYKRHLEFYNIQVTFNPLQHHAHALPLYLRHYSGHGGGERQQSGL